MYSYLIIIIIILFIYILFIFILLHCYFIKHIEKDFHKNYVFKILHSLINCI